MSFLGIGALGDANPSAVTLQTRDPARLQQWIGVLQWYAGKAGQAGTLTVAHKQKLGALIGHLRQGRSMAEALVAERSREKSGLGADVSDSQLQQAANQITSLQSAIGEQQSALAAIQAEIAALGSDRTQRANVRAYQKQYKEHAKALQRNQRALQQAQKVYAKLYQQYQKQQARLAQQSARQEQRAARQAARHGGTSAATTPPVTIPAVQPTAYDGGYTMPSSYDAPYDLPAYTAPTSVQDTGYAPGLVSAGGGAFDSESYGVPSSAGGAALTPEAVPSAQPAPSALGKFAILGLLGAGAVMLLAGKKGKR